MEEKEKIGIAKTVEGSNNLAFRIKEALDYCKALDEAYLGSSSERGGRIADFFKFNAKTIEKLQEFSVLTSFNPEEAAEVERICNELEGAYDKFLEGS